MRAVVAPVAMLGKDTQDVQGVRGAVLAHLVHGKSECLLL